MGIFVPVVVDADHWDAETTSRRVVFIRVGRLCRRVHWTTGTMRDLQVLVCREFGAPEDLVYVRAKQNDSNPFILFHSESGKGHVDAAPLVWPDADLRNGSVVSVRDPLWQAVLALCAGEGDAARSRRSTKRADQNLPPLTPTAAPFSKAAKRMSNEAESAATEEKERARPSSAASDSETGQSAGVDDVSESDFSAGSSRGVQDAKRSVGTNAESTGGLARYLMPFSGALSAVQSGPTHRRVHVARGDMPRHLAKTLAQRASVLSNLDDLTARERVDVLLNDPGSSPAAATIGAAMITLILVSTVTFCVETLPWFYDPEPSFDSGPFLAIEASCIAAFTAELSLRFWATDDRNGFFKRGMNVVDFVAIVPFYVDLLARGVSFPGLSVLRVLRLARVFRLLRVSKTAVDLLGRTMSRSARPLYILGFLLTMALITFAAVLYFAERGEYDATRGLWMRTTGFECDVPCEEKTLDFTPAFLACGDDAAIASDAETNTVVSAYFDRHVPSALSVGETCERVTEQSPFQSIPHAVWWAVATMGTVGYGDIAPRTLAGWIMASVAQMMGILVIALPVTVIGSNFSAIYSSIGTSQSLCAKEHEPSAAAKPRRLHASGSGATAAKLTDGGMVGPLQHEWDLDVAFDELLPCAAPALVANGNDGANDRLGGDARDLRRASLRGQLGPANSWTMTRRALTPEQQMEAFLKGEDLHENPRAAGASPTPADPGVGAERDGSRENEKSRLGVRDLSAALREAKDEKDKKDSVPDRPRFEPPKVSRKSGRARRAALCALAEAFLADCVRNPEVRDKFAATRQRDSLKKGDSLFIKNAGDAGRGARTNGPGPKSRASVDRSAGETDVSSVATSRQKSLRAPKTPQPSFAMPRTEKEDE